ncbi:hypothetical protein AGDE_11095 [Angomonas deanei]|nr:hypothetical protein AGDE_11095 [Angomonas deanei]|eukprot:EPY26780.1 hypothetical protein AGDE_11095 [Angomonas deanei]
MDRSIRIDTTNTRYHVIRAAASLVGWTVVYNGDEEIPAEFYSSAVSCSKGEEVDVVWTDKSVTTDRVRSLTCFQRLNHFPGIDCVARKAQLFHRVMRILKLSEGARQTTPNVNDHLKPFFPKSFVYPRDSAQILAYKDTVKPYFIVKPAKSCEGKGILLCKNPVERLESVEKSPLYGNCLVQEYVENPLLIDGKKFDLRLYVLLTRVADSSKSGGLEGIRLFMHQECLVRICADPYHSPTPSNEHDSTVHLSNYAVNKKTANFVAPSEGEHNDSNKRDSAFMKPFIDAYCAEKGIPHWWDTVWRRIGEAVVLAVLSGVNVLRREFVGAGAAHGHRADCSGCFELMGFDVMFTANTLQPIVLEITIPRRSFVRRKRTFGLSKKW